MQPISHRFRSDPKEGEYKHPLSLVFCEECGLVQIPDPIPVEELYTNYHWLSSWKENPHSPGLVELIEGLPGLDKSARIIEVASNDGTFLDGLRQVGFENVLGIEPAQDARNAALGKNIETISGYFDVAMADQVSLSHGQPDLLIARHVLEHVPNLHEFGAAVQRLSSPDGYVLIEVPNYEFDLSVGDYSCVWEEYVNGFTRDTLERWLMTIGIEVVHSGTVVFCGETMFVLGRRSDSPAAKTNDSYMNDLRTRAYAFRDKWPKFQDEFIRYMEDHNRDGRKIAVYGAGHRACALNNFVGLAPFIELVVDDQSTKQGKFMPGSGLPILPGETLEDRFVDLCLLAVNAESEQTVIGNHSVYRERGGTFASILPPSERLLPLWNSVY